MPTGHSVSSLGESPMSFPMAILGVALIVTTFLTQCFPKTLQKWGFSISSQTLEVVENLPKFSQVVKLNDSLLLREETQYYQKFGFDMTPSRAIENLK